VVEYGYGGADWKDKLTSYDGQSLTYDGAGNLTSYNGQTYTWDMGRRLQSITGGSLNAQYGYNAEGIRVRKTVNGVLTTYGLVNGRVIWEKTGGQRIDYRYDGNDKLISMQIDNTEYFYVHNIQGDIVGLVDQTGGAVAHYAYDAWGVSTSITDGQGNDVSGDASAIANVNPYRYRGYRYDRETGLYYLQSRYYNPVWGRFINMDDCFIAFYNSSLMCAENLFSYCAGNPVMYKDANGYFYYGNYPGDFIYDPEIPATLKMKITYNGITITAYDRACNTPVSYRKRGYQRCYIYDAKKTSNRSIYLKGWKIGDFKIRRVYAKAVVEKLREMKLKEAAEKVEKGILETLSYMDFPREHWTKIHSNNAIERLNREIRRRTRVVGTFPDGHSALMLVCARLRHMEGSRWGTVPYMSMKHLENQEVNALQIG